MECPTPLHTTGGLQMKPTLLSLAIIEWTFTDGEEIGAKGELRDNVLACSIRGTASAFTERLEPLVRSCELLKDCIKGARGRAPVIDVSTQLDPGDHFSAVEARFEFDRGRFVVIDGRLVGAKFVLKVEGNDPSLLRHDAFTDILTAIEGMETTVKEAARTMDDPMHVWKRLFRSLTN